MTETEPFRPGLNAAEFASFKWLLLGHLLFAGGLWLAFSVELSIGYVWITPLYALPLVIMGPKERRLARVLVLLLGMTVIHYCAWTAAVESVTPNSGGLFTTLPSRPDYSQLLPGAMGGLVGAAGFFALCFVSRLAPRSRANLIVAILGTLLLGAIGSASVYQLLVSPGDAGIWPWFGVYTPWQLAFAYFLAKLLR